MPTHPISGVTSPLAAGSDTPPAYDRWSPPTLEVICLACEISAYAPDGDLPLF